MIAFEKKPTGLYGFVPNKLEFRCQFQEIVQDTDVNEDKLQDRIQKNDRINKGFSGERKGKKWFLDDGKEEGAE